MTDGPKTGGALGVVLFVQLNNVGAVCPRSSLAVIVVGVGVGPCPPGEEGWRERESVTLRLTSLCGRKEGYRLAQQHVHTMHYCV